MAGRHIVLTAVPGIPLIEPGDDIGAIVLESLKRASIVPRDSDVLVIAQKIMSKAEGRYINLRDVVASVAPLPLAAIHSTNDEFVPVSQARELLARAGRPSTLWVVPARDHRFSDNRPEFERRLTEAFTWIEQNQPR